MCILLLSTHQSGFTGYIKEKLQLSYIVYDEVVMSTLHNTDYWTAIQDSRSIHILGLKVLQ